MILCALAGVQIVWFVSLQWPVFVTPMPQVMSKNLSPPAVQTQEPSPRSKTSSVIRPIPRAMCSWPAGGAIAAGEDATDGRRSAGEEEEECDGSVAKKAALILSVAGSPRRLGRCFMSDFDIVGDTFILLLSSKDIFP
jgi:hypothetical protein